MGQKRIKKKVIKVRPSKTTLPATPKKSKKIPPEIKKKFEPTKGPVDSSEFVAPKNVDSPSHCPITVRSGIETVCLSNEHLLALKYHASEQRLLLEGHRRRVLEAHQIEQEAIAKSRKLLDEASKMEQDKHVLKDDHTRLIARLSEYYKVDFELVTYDDETGVLTVHTPENTAEDREKMKKK